MATNNIMELLPLRITFNVVGIKVFAADPTFAAVPTGLATTASVAAVPAMAVPRIFPAVVFCNCEADVFPDPGLITLDMTFPMATDGTRASF